jgi:hypothetical protein
MKPKYVKLHAPRENSWAHRSPIQRSAADCHHPPSKSHPSGNAINDVPAAKAIHSKLFDSISLIQLTEAFRTSGSINTVSFCRWNFRNGVAMKTTPAVFSLSTCDLNSALSATLPP